jgi:thiol peroxidase
MAKITLKGNTIQTSGSLPSVGTKGPDFKLTKTDLSDASLGDFKGKKIVMNIFPSLDTSVCATSVRKFNAEADKLANTVILCISKDLPFAHNRFCATEGLKNVISLSELRDDSFSKAYGIKIMDGPMAGLFSRAIVVLDTSGKVVYSEQVPEITQEPDYEAALKAVK